MGLAVISLGGYIFYIGVPEIWETIFLISLAFCILYQSIVIIPYTAIYKNQVKTSTSPPKDSAVSLLVANVLMTNNRSDILLKLISHCNPDIILAVETNSWWQKQLNRLEKEYPYKILYPLNNTYGMLLYSRLELRKSKISFLVEPDIPSIFTRILLRNGEEIDFYGLHPTPPVPGENERSTERDAELLIVGKAVKKENRPVIVAGDMNDVAWSYTTKLFQKISGLLDPRIGRGLFNTFNAKYPLLRWPLDHVFHSRHFSVVQLNRLPYFGSDHFPIHIKLHFDPLASLTQEVPTADKGEQAEAEEKIEKV
jgi:endonuclease/exonuclease/phosphatase (EEP) superfamily protein YafD